jgi:hypothetical protein
MVNTPTSTSASQPKSSAASWASVIGLAILANPHGISGSKTIALDAQLYLGLTDQDLLIGSLCYFNSKNHTFEDAPNLYSIVATVSVLFFGSFTTINQFSVCSRGSMV